MAKELKLLCDLTEWCATLNWERKFNIEQEYCIKPQVLLEKGKARQGRQGEAMARDDTQKDEETKKNEIGSLSGKKVYQQ